MSMIKCECGAQIPSSKVAEWEGKCPRCQGKQQQNSTRPLGVKSSIPKIRKGFVKCITCSAQIPQAKATEWEGKCPKCRSISQGEIKKLNKAQ